MAKDKEFEHSEARPDEELQIADPPAPGGQQAGQGSPTGGPEDPGAEEQNPSGEADEQENEPLPRTWN